MELIQIRMEINLKSGEAIKKGQQMDRSFKPNTKQINSIKKIEKYKGCNNMNAPEK